MRNLFKVGIALMMLLAVNVQVQAQEKGVKTEQATANYAKGDQFESMDFGTLTLVSERKIQGLETWKVKAEKEGKARTLYVPVSFLSTCVRINNQK